MIFGSDDMGWQIIETRDHSYAEGYEQAIQSGNKDRAAQLRAEIDANWRLMGDTP